MQISDGPSAGSFVGDIAEGAEIDREMVGSQDGGGADGYSRRTGLWPCRLEWRVRRSSLKPDAGNVGGWRCGRVAWLRPLHGFA